MRPVFYSLLVVFTFSCFAQDFGSLTDSRDGQEYKILEVEIPLEGGISVTRTWMAENLNYETESSYCYKSEPAYCGKFGRLYTFESAKEACPEGWRVPTRLDWMMLFSAYGGDAVAGVSLKEGGDSNLDLFLGGFGDASGSFKGVGVEGNYWDSEEISGNTAGVITVRNSSPGIFHSKIGKAHRNSCRCIKDY